MGNGMNKILPGLYIGNFRVICGPEFYKRDGMIEARLATNVDDAKDMQQLRDNKITHILAVHDNAAPVLDDFKYKCISVSDAPDQDLSKYFLESIEFIHQARANNGGVLVHCIAGVSRSSTMVAAYLLTVTKVGWQEAIEAIRCCRHVANPNFGFQRQLQEFEVKGRAAEARRKLLKKYTINDQDEEYIQQVLRADASNGLAKLEDDKLHSETFKHYEKQRTSDEAKPK